MKKVLSRIASFSLAIMVAFGLLIVPASVPVHADLGPVATVTYSKNLTLYSGSEYGNNYEIKMAKKLKNAKSVKVTSSKKSVVESYDWYKGDKFIIVNAKKPGSVTLTIKVKKASGTKTYKINVTVKKNVNPFKSFKVGSKSVTSKFKKEQYADVKTADGVKRKISIKMKSGYKLKKIVCSTYNETTEELTSKTIKNNSKIKIDKDNTMLYLKIYDTKTKITCAYYLNFM